MAKTRDFLKEFLSRTRIPGIGTKEGNQKKYEESKKNLFGIPSFPVPEYGVSEFMNLPTKEEKIQKEQKKKLEEAAFEKKLADVRGGDLTLNPDGTVSTAEKYGPKRRAGDLLERYAGQQIDQSQLLGYTQALTNQDIAAMSETNRQRLETNLAFDRDSPTRMQERQLTAKKGEALLAKAVADQATSAAQIGGLGTARTYGSGRVN